MLSNGIQILTNLTTLKTQNASKYDLNLEINRVPEYLKMYISISSQINCVSLIMWLLSTDSLMICFH